MQHGYVRVGTESQLAYILISGMVDIKWLAMTECSAGLCTMSGLIMEGRKRTVASTSCSAL